MSKGFVDLHVHLRGTIGPSLAKKLSARNGEPLHMDLYSHEGVRKWASFSEFLSAYDVVARCVRTATDLEDVAYSYLVNSAAVGCIYVEFMLSPPDLIKIGISYHEQLKSLSIAAQRAKEECGIESRLIVTCVRHFGPDAAVEVAELATSVDHPYVVGFGLVGDERRFGVEQFGPAFGIAQAAGLKLTAHAGEHCGADTIMKAISALKLHRVGHGITATNSPLVMNYLAKNRIGLEVCISSNIALGIFPTLLEHPLKTLMAAGIPISLGTDDPAFFATDISQEYDLAEMLSGTAQRVSEKISIDAIDMAFCDESTKGKLRSLIRFI